MRMIRWAWLLSKRLYKKAAFLLLLLLIPLAVFGLGMMAREDHGILHILLVQKNSSDPISASVVARLEEEQGLIRFSLCPSQERAEELVLRGKADGAWVFEEDLSRKIAEFFSRPLAAKGLVTVLEREATVPLRLARERLCGALFECCSQRLFLDYVRSHSEGALEVEDEVLLEYYRNAFTAVDTLFEISYADSSVSVEQIDYLTAPVRGLLSVMIALCSLAAGIWFLQDFRGGLFSWLPFRRVKFVEFGYQYLTVLNLAAFCLVALFAVGLGENLFWEIFVLLLYCLSAFGCFLRALFGSTRILALAMPLSALLMIVCCPVFFSLSGRLSWVRFLFPPTYYLEGLGDGTYLLWMVLYTLLLWGFSRLLSRFRPS